MFGEALKRKYRLSDRGVANTKKGVFWTLIVNLIVIAGVSIPYRLLQSFVDILTIDTPLPKALPVV